MNEVKVATINNVAIVVIDGNQKLVPIKPICEILGIDAKAQRDRINRDEIYSSIGVMTTSVGADGKDREMLCLPIEFISGWIFSIDTSRVSEEAKPNVIRYKMECHKVLYQHFIESSQFLKEKEIANADALQIFANAKRDFHQAKNILTAAERKLYAINAMTIEQWRLDKLMFDIPFTTAVELGGRNA
jgi:hypothetical protein